MVGVFLTVWVKSDIREDVHNMKVSCVGRGLMGYLGNKVYLLIYFNCRVYYVLGLKETILFFWISAGFYIN
jgi:hypothetical protein